MKRLTLIGILLVLFAFAVLYISAWQIQSSFSSGQIYALSLQSNTVGYSQFNLANTTVVGIGYYTNNTPLTYYLLNLTGFSNAAAYINSSSAFFNASNSLEGNGALEIVWNSPSGIFPATTNLTTFDIYSLNESPQLPAGVYYNVFDTVGQPNVTVYYSVVERSPKQISSSILSNAIYGIIGAALFIGGIIAMLYSIFLVKGPKKEVKDEEAYKMYESIVKKPNGKRKGKSRRKGSGRS